MVRAEATASLDFDVGSGERGSQGWAAACLSLSSNL